MGRRKLLELLLSSTSSDSNDVDGAWILNQVLNFPAAPSVFIQKTIKNCSLSNPAKTIDIGSTYIAEIIPDPGKAIETLVLTVLYNGEDITSTCYDPTTHVITIQNVQYNININAKIDGLPAGYTAYDWIQSSGTQYLQTGYAVTSGLKYEVDFMLISYTTGEHWITATFGGGLNLQCGTNNGSSFNTSGGITYEYSGSTIVNARAKATFTLSGTTSRPLFIFAQNEGSAYHLGHGSYKLYGYKIYDSSSNLAMELRPCVRNSDSKPGVFDMISETFITNSGTGEFTYGND